jgi:hypothetical protein
MGQRLEVYPPREAQKKDSARCMAARLAELMFVARASGTA